MDGIIALAEQQAGVVAAHQLRSLGLSRAAMHRLDHYHGWERLSGTVWRRLGSPATDAQRAAAAVLDVGANAHLSGESGASFWGHRGCTLEPFEVTTDQKASRARLLAGTVHRVRRVHPRWVTTLRGVPVARPELVGLQLFASMHAGRAERIVEWFWSRRLLSGGSLARLLDDLGARGRNGVGGLRRYLEVRGDGYVPPASGLESRVATILSDAGIPVRRQVDLGDETAWTGRVDFLHDRLPLVIEVQSESFHGALVDEVADRVRRDRLEAAGFVVVEVWDTEVWSDRAAVVAKVRSGVRSVPCPSR